MYFLIKVFYNTKHLGLAAEPVNKGGVGEEAILILRISNLSEKFLDHILGDLITKVGQDVVKLSKHHGAIGVLVIQLHQFNVVSIGALGIRGSNGSLDLGNNLIKLGKLLALLISLALGNTDLLGHIESKSISNVAKVEKVELALAIPVIDVTDLQDCLSISHCRGVSLFVCSLNSRQVLPM